MESAVESATSLRGVRQFGSDCDGFWLAWDFAGMATG
jgi:hypothetical protein